MVAKGKIRQIKQGTSMKITDWWIPLALAGSAGGANFYVLNQATEKKPGVRVMVAAKDLAAGSTLTANDLTVVRLQVDGEANSLKGFILEQDVGLVENRRLVRPAKTGEILALSDVSRAGDNLLSLLGKDEEPMTLLIPSGRVGFGVTPGDLVRVTVFEPVRDVDGQSSGSMPQKRGPFRVVAFDPSPMKIHDREYLQCTLAVRTKESASYADSLAILSLRAKEGGDDQVASLERLPKENMTGTRPAVSQPAVLPSASTPIARQ